MRPERVVEGEVSELFGIVRVEKSGCISDHVDAQFAVKVLLSLVEGPNPHTHFDTHVNIIRFLNLT